MSFLCLVRHGQSQWNALGKWTGLTDIPLSLTGEEESEKAGGLLQQFSFDAAYTSKLSRAIQTLEIIKQRFRNKKIPIIVDPALNERDYGIHTGKNKWELEKRVGEEEFKKLRRGWNHPVQNGETLKDVYNRVVPYYESEILPKLKNGENILIVAHGNSLRALVKFLENISDEDIEKLDIETGEIYVYNIDTTGHVVSKEIKK